MERIVTLDLWSTYMVYSFWSLIYFSIKFKNEYFIHRLILNYYIREVYTCHACTNLMLIQTMSAKPLNRLIVLSKNRHRDVLATAMVPFFALIAKYHNDCFIPSVWLDGRMAASLLCWKQSMRCCLISGWWYLRPRLHESNPTWNGYMRDRLHKCLHESGLQPDPD